MHQISHPQCDRSLDNSGGEEQSYVPEHGLPGPDIRRQSCQNQQQRYRKVISTYR